MGSRVRRRRSDARRRLALRTSDAAAGISISASHNPFEDNGVKIFGHDGMKLPDDERGRDRRRVARAPADDDAMIRIAAREDPALDRNSTSVPRRGRSQDALRGKSVVLDTGYGAAYRIAPEVFRRVGAEVVVINDQPNGRNIDRGCRRDASGALAKSS